MSVALQNPSFNSSGTSSQFDSSDTVETTKVKNYAKDLLKGRIFLGRYVERRLIDQRIGYRDVVVLSPAEVELKKDLIDIQHKLKIVCPLSHNIIIGVVEAQTLGINSTGLCICTEIENQPFGPLWFQIRSIKFRPEEVMVTVKCLRYISEAYQEIEPILTGVTPLPMIKESSITKSDINSTKTLSESYNDIVGILKDALSIRNVKELLKFLFALIVAVFTGSTAFINFLGNFVLALLRELSILVKNSTPMFLGLLDFFSKIVGGFYILLAMFFKQSHPPPHQRNVPYYQQRYPPVQHYDDKEFD